MEAERTPNLHISVAVDSNGKMFSLPTGIACILRNIKTQAFPIYRINS